jgi:hypothetical protein
MYGDINRRQIRRQQVLVEIKYVLSFLEAGGILYTNNLKYLLFVFIGAKKIYSVWLSVMIYCGLWYIPSIYCLTKLRILSLKKLTVSNRDFDYKRYTAKLVFQKKGPFILKVIL